MYTGDRKMSAPNAGGECGEAKCQNVKMTQANFIKPMQITFAYVCV